MEARLHAAGRPELGAPYTVPGYPGGNNPANGLPWAPATDGLRNITGRVNRDGTATIWAITSTVSGNGDQGADPNKLVAITDSLARPARSDGGVQHLPEAGYGEVLRGVSFTPRGERATTASADRRTTGPAVSQGGPRLLTASTTGFTTLPPTSHS